MSRENVELVRRAWEAWERRDMTAVFELYAPDIVWDMTHSDVPDGGVYHGHQGVKTYFQGWAVEPFDEYYAHADAFWDAGSHVVVRIRQGGRGKGSGARVEMPPIWQVYELRGGKAVRVTPYPTEREALEAVGLRE